MYILQLLCILEGLVSKAVARGIDHRGIHRRHHSDIANGPGTVDGELERIDIVVPERIFDFDADEDRAPGRDAVPRNQAATSGLIEKADLLEAIAVLPLPRIQCVAIGVQINAIDIHHIDDI